MEKRLYKSVEPRYSFTDKRDGITFGTIIKGENTIISVNDNMQKKGNMQKPGQILFFVEFLDLNKSMSIKFNHDKDSRYIKYALSQLNPMMDEYYKTALLLCKKFFKEMLETTEYSYNKFLSGEYSFPINKDNHLMYLDHINDYKKLYDSIDVEEADLTLLN